MARLRAPEQRVRIGLRGLVCLLEAGFGLHRRALSNAASAVEADRDAARVRRDVASTVKHIAIHAELQGLSRAN